MPVANTSGPKGPARKHKTGGAAPDLKTFLSAAQRATDPNDLLALSSADLETALRGTHALIAEAEGSDPLIRIGAPLRIGTTLAVPVAVLSSDKPFIVDSVLGAIRARGGQVRLVSHPILGAGEDALSVLTVLIEPMAEGELAVLAGEIEASMRDVAAVVADWPAMTARLDAAAASLANARPSPERDEAQAFIAWLEANNFTFLGTRNYRLADGVLEPEPESGLGVLRDPAYRFLRAGAEFVEMTPQHKAFLKSAAPLMVTKANVRARVHRRSHMDYVGIKLFDDKGKVTGELRVLGLFTSHALNQPHAEVPLVRTKIAEVVRRAGLDANGHAGKTLLHALAAYPRDELFQVGMDELTEFATDIAALGDRPRVRVLPRVDPFDNFVSILLYMPRERYDADNRARIGDYLAKAYDGRVSAWYPHFLEGDLVRVHFIIGRDAGKTPRPDRGKLEADITALSRDFGDRLMAEARDPGAAALYRDAFSPAYQSHSTPAQALVDIGIFERLRDDARIAVDFGPSGLADGNLGLKLYHRGSPIPLSDRVPLLENFGFRVIDERTYTIKAGDGIGRFLHDMVLVPADGGVVDLGRLGESLQAALIAVWDGLAESDRFNALVVRAGLAWQDIAILRALARYLRQLNITYSHAYLAEVLSAQPAAARHLVALFHALHDPAVKAGGRQADAARAGIEEALGATTSLDEERILKRFANLVEASLRTNAYQRDEAGAPRPAFAIKFDCAAVEGMPEPHPYREIFVYSPRVEGVHLRFGAIARGGIRWSDRPQDFRTEVLGLVKAQQVKNAVIVPVGAKGGFVPKLMPKGAARDVVQAEGTACYRIFIGSLLDITDNLEGDHVVPPAGVLRRDGDDPYLVVAADKGTASFSDIANSIALSRGFWLGDAFASGGSAGYDHKKMGITARGAWEAVKRHFREMDRDIQKEPFTVVGVGDMSGDVFGNGMLLSKATRLVAAFDHRDIFIDPDPDATKSYAERKRLFALPRSSWQDYDTSKISRGGGVFSRTAKSIPLSPEARKALGVTAAALTPSEVMTAILRADVDLLWFGGIGTYVRAAGESDAEVGDRANDAIRVAGRDLRARVVGEGANLAMTQRGRIEYALAGGRLNTDAIDNSAGVNSSDLEVNIKIALGTLVRAGVFDTEGRNVFLAQMTPEVAELCLRNNYLQTLALSLTERRGMAEFPDHRELMLTLEREGHLNRAVEFLPSNAVLNDRETTRQPLTRPELAVLLAYAKLTLYDELLASSVPDDAYLGRELFRYFPETLNTTYPEAVTSHRLRREVIATVLANAMINRGGPAYVRQMMAATSATAADVAFAYAAARDAYGLPALNAEIDGQDGRIEGATQLALYAEVEALLRRESLWFLRNASFADGLAPLVERYKAGVDELRQALPGMLPPLLKASVARKAEAFRAGGTPKALAERIAALSTLSFSTDIVFTAGRNGVSPVAAAKAFFGVLELFDLGDILLRARDLVLADRFDRMALDRANANLWRALRDLSADVLAEGGDPNAYRARRAEAVGRTAKAVADITQGELTVSRLSVAAGLLSDLASGT